MMESSGSPASREEGMESCPSTPSTVIDDRRSRQMMSPTLTRSTTEKSTKRMMVLFHVVMILNQLNYAADVLLVKSALSSASFNQIVYAIYRDVVAVVVLFAMAQFLERKQRTPLKLPFVGALIVCGFSGPFAGQLLLLRGLSLSSAAALSSVLTFVPLISYTTVLVCRLEVLKWWRLDGWIKILGMVVASVGAILLTVRGPAVLGPLQGNGTHSEHPLHLLASSAEQDLLGTDNYQLGLLICFVGVFISTIYYSAMIPVLDRYPIPFTLAAYAYFAGACFLAVSGFILVDPAEWIIDDPYTLFVCFYEGVMISAIAMATTVWGMTEAGPILSSSYFPLQTFTTFVASYLFFHDIIFLGQLVGGSVIIIGLYVLTYGKIQTARLDMLEEQLKEPLLKSAHSYV